MRDSKQHKEEELSGEIQNSKEVSRIQRVNRSMEKTRSLYNRISKCYDVLSNFSNWGMSAAATENGKWIIQEAQHTVLHILGSMPTATGIQPW